MQKSLIFTGHTLNGTVNAVREQPLLNVPVSDTLTLRLPLGGEGRGSFQASPAQGERRIVGVPQSHERKVLTASFNRHTSLIGGERENFTPSALFPTPGVRLPAPLPLVEGIPFWYNFLLLK